MVDCALKKKGNLWNFVKVNGTHFSYQSSLFLQTDALIGDFKCGRHQHGLLDGEVGKEVIVLHNVAAQFARLPDLDLPADAGFGQTGEDVHKARFARPRGAHYGGKFARLERTLDALQHGLLLCE